jgi:ribosomal protein L11 methyltransferase
VSESVEGPARGASGDWLSVRVHPGTSRDAVVAALFAVGSRGVQELGDELTTLLPGDTNADEVVCAVLAASADARVETVHTPVVDWSEQWRQGIHAQELGPLVIAPPWLAAQYEPARTIVIDPGMAFGTGEHPTTRCVVRLLPSVLRSGDRVADLGAGSAVLSIAAAKLGAARVVAIEIDHDAIGNAEENVIRNGVADRVSVLEGDAETLLPLVAPVRLILANIISSVLVALLPAITGALDVGGQAIISGILLEERGDMISVLQANGWRVEAEDREEIWWSAVIAKD